MIKDYTDKLERINREKIKLELLSNLPKESACDCSPMTIDAWGCSCGAEIRNNCLKEVKECIEKVMR